MEVINQEIITRVDHDGEPLSKLFPMGEGTEIVGDRMRRDSYIRKAQSNN